MATKRMVAIAAPCLACAGASAGRDGGVEAGTGKWSIDLDEGVTRRIKQEWRAANALRLLPVRVVLGAAARSLHVSFWVFDDAAWTSEIRRGALKHHTPHHDRQGTQRMTLRCMHDRSME